MCDIRFQGIVGSRKYKNKRLVENLIDLLPSKTIVVSGGCIGVDTWAVSSAEARGIICREILPISKDREGYFVRNKLIAKLSSQVVAFIPRNIFRSGAWNTIKWCRELGTPYIVLDENGAIWDREWSQKGNTRNV